MTYSKTFNLVMCIALLGTLFIGNAFAEGNIKTLPEVSKEGKVSLMKALQDRKSTRSFNDRDLSPQVLGDLLWATWGINREDGKHTIPTARNRQEIQVYVALEDGVWLYEPKDHTLILKNKDDVRSKIGSGAAVLIYAAPDDEYASYHVGSLYQNAGLYSASVNLGNIVRAQPVKKLKDTLVLPDKYKVHMTQAVGYTD